MSLINQALRKAQRDRTPTRMGDSDSPGPVHPNTPDKKTMNPGLIAGLIVAVAVLAGLVAGLSVVLLRSPQAGSNTSASSPEIASSRPEAATPDPSEQIRTEPLVSQREPSPNTDLQRNLSGPTVVEELRAAREAAETQLAAEAKAAEEAARRAAAPPNQEAIEWLSRASLTGVKISPTGGKVILNGESYAVGEYVNPSLGLKVMVVQEERVLFMDDNGKKYMKRL